MKKILLLTVSSFLLFFAACEKDEITTDTGAPIVADNQYVVTKFKNNYQIAKYTFTKTKLIHLNRYNGSGQLLDSAIFNYQDDQLNSMTRMNTGLGTSETTNYHYGSNGKMNQIEVLDISSDSKTFTIFYDNSGGIKKVKWTRSSSSVNGEFSFDTYGNVNEYKYNYPVSSSVNDNQSNWVSFDHYPNVVQRFWVTDPTMEYLSINNPVENLQTISRFTAGSSGSGGTWEYINESWNMEYTYDADGFVLTQQVLDTNNAVVNSFAFDYQGF